MRGGAQGRTAAAVVLAILAGSLSSGFAAMRAVAPGDGAVLASPGVVVTAREDGAVSGAVEVLLNGGTVASVTPREGVLSTGVTLREGRNLVTFRSPSSVLDLVLEYRPGGSGHYRFHPGYLEGECGECHAEAPGGSTGERQVMLCNSCHDRMDEAPFLHGPVGAGQCTFCHDPHGSSEGALLTRSGASLCTACHDQPSSRAHLDGSRGRRCVECHDPHGSGKKYFIR